MKIVIFFRLDCFADKYSNSYSNSYIVNVFKRAPNRKDCDGRKGVKPSTFAMNMD